MWMFANAIACGNTFVLKPSREGPVGVAVPRRAAAARPGCPTACFNVVQRRPGGGRPHPRAPRRRGGELRRLDPDRPLHLRDGHAPTASGCRRSAARRTTWWCCPTPTSTWPPTRRCRAAYGSAGERCMAVSVVRRRRRGRPTRWSTAIARPHPRACVVGPGSEPDSEMGPLITGEHRDKVAGYVDGRRRPRAPRSSSTAARATCPATASSSAPIARRPRDARDGLLPGRDLRAGAVGRAGAAPTTTG